MMYKMATSNASSPSNKPYIYIREEGTRVTIIEGDNSSDIGHIVEVGIMIDYPTDKTFEETTLQVATEIIIEEGDTEVSQDNQIDEDILVGKVLG